VVPKIQNLNRKRKKKKKRMRRRKKKVKRVKVLKVKRKGPSLRCLIVVVTPLFSMYIITPFLLMITTPPPTHINSSLLL
jgi:hypothetical protein